MTCHNDFCLIFVPFPHVSSVFVTKYIAPRFPSRCMVTCMCGEKCWQSRKERHDLGNHCYLLSYFQHVHVHVLPRRAGDFSRNDDVYKEVGAACHFLFRVVFTVRKSPWWYRTCLEWNYIMISLHFYWLQKACDKHQALYWDFLVSSGSSCGHKGSQWRMQSTFLVLQFVATHSVMWHLYQWLCSLILWVLGKRASEG